MSRSARKPVKGLFGKQYIIRKIERGLLKSDGVRIDSREVEKIGYSDIYDWANYKGYIAHHIFTKNPQTAVLEHTTTVITKSWAHLIKSLYDLIDQCAEDLQSADPAFRLVQTHMAKRFKQEHDVLLSMYRDSQLINPIMLNGQYMPQSPGYNYWLSADCYPEQTSTDSAAS